jgi:thiol-disulfide isomerase/thioredoxin
MELFRMRRNLGAFSVVFASLLAVWGVSGCRSSLSPSVSASNGKTTGALKDEPNVSFKDFKGSSISLESFKGKVVLVNFWETSCEPCRTEIPWLIEFQQKYASKGFTLVGVAMDDEGTSVVQPWVQKTTFDVNGQPTLMNYPIVIGNDEVADKFGGLWAYPTSFLLTREGKIAKKYIGLISQPDLDKQIQDLLGS